MLVSYKWLQTYFDETLPNWGQLGEFLTMRVLELDSIIDTSDEAVLDVKVLADRAHYCLSHRGIAGEIAAVTGLSRKTSEKPDIAVQESVQRPVVNLLDEECGRYIARRIEDVTVSRSHDRIVEFLETLGQRSINVVVDATNFVMLDMGQPLHAFDADKLKGGITVRKAHSGERITTLDGKDVVLNPSVLLIADDAGPLAIAGIKGGTRAQVDEKTKNIILEAAYFKPGSTRKTSMALGIRTDASKRFETGLTPEYAPIAMEEVTALILKESRTLPKVGPVVDIYPQPAQKTVLSVHLSEINKRLGVEVPRDEAIAILKRLSIDIVENGDALTLTIPYERLDLAIPEDIVDEVGRLYGYEKLPDQLPPPGVTSTIDRLNYYIEKIKDILVGLGFYEVYLYSLVESGDFEIELPLAEDKKFLRTSLVPGISHALKFNANNAPLLGLDQIKLFEFGSVFPKGGEKIMLGLGIENAPGYKGGKPQEEIQKTIEKFAEALGLPADVLENKTVEDGIVEWPLDTLLEKLPEAPQEPVHYEINRTAIFQTFSPYPFIARDIALWVNEGTSAQEIESILKETAGELLVRLSLFDEYEKDDRISYAFRLVFQSPDRTLTNEEINTIMDRVTAAVTAKNWEVR